MVALVVSYHTIGMASRERDLAESRNSTTNVEQWLLITINKREIVDTHRPIGPLRNIQNGVPLCP